MNKKEKEMKDMSIIELMEFWIEDWNKEEPSLEESSISNQWSELVTKKIRGESVLTLLKVLDLAHEDIDYLEELWKIRKYIGEALVGDLYEKVEQIETSVKLLLKEHDLEPAKITVGQLNRLKGGV